MKFDAALNKICDDQKSFDENNCTVEMAYQQKLLYIASLIVVGAAILVGIQNFESSSRDANIDALTLDLMNIAMKLQANYFKPECLAGGDHSFSGIATDSSGLQRFFIKSNNINGTFKIVSANDEVLVIQAIGKEDYDGDGQNLAIEMKVFADSVETVVVNY